MQVIYVDTLFFIDFIVNYLILLLTAKICSVPVSRLRLAASAALGGAYSVAAVLPDMGFLMTPLVKIAAGVLMVLAAFGGQKKLLRLMLVFFSVAAGFGGAVLAVSLIGGREIGDSILTPLSLKILFLSFAVCYTVMTLIFRRVAKQGGGIVQLTLRCGGRELNMKALMDTGNSLTDPMTGRPVIIAGVTEVGALLPLGARKTVAGLRAKDAVKVMEELGNSGQNVGFQLIPYSAVGVPGGMLLAFRPDEVVVDGKKRKGLLVALSPNSVSDGGPYSALIGA